jgi:hypothetical protein
MEKGSPEAIAFGKKMKALRDKKGGAKISRPNVERGEPQPAKVKGGKIPSPPSRSYDTSQEDKIDGIMISGGSLKDCPTCCGCGIVKLMKKGYTG